MLAHQHVEGVLDRWGYLLRTLDAGKLLDEPIPRIEFWQPDRQVYSALEKWVQVPGWDMGGWSDFRKLLDWLSWGLGLCGEMPELEEAKAERLYRDVNLVPMLESPYDYFGAWISERKTPHFNPNAFYPTPHCICEMMVAMMGHDDGDCRSKTVCDPCVGSGRMLLHASNHSLRLYGQDIDPLVVAVCKINMALYAPWGAFPVPESYFGAAAPLPVPDSPQADPFRIDDAGAAWLF